MYFVQRFGRAGSVGDVGSFEVWLRRGGEPAPKSASFKPEPELVVDESRIWYGMVWVWYGYGMGVWVWLGMVWMDGPGYGEPLEVCRVLPVCAFFPHPVYFH